jgi:hypothetical protein
VRDVVIAVAVVVFALTAIVEAFFHLLRAGPSVARRAVAALALPVLALPLLVPADARLVRFVVALSCMASAAKFIVLARRAAPAPTRRDYLLFVTNLTSLSFDGLAREPRPSRARTLRALWGGVAQALLGSAAVGIAWHIDFGGAFVLEHVVKVFAFWIPTVGALSVIVSTSRLMTGTGRDVFRGIFTARTPADFWRRYNRTVGQFLYEQVFLPSGGARRPVRGTLLAFAASSLLHEYIFGMALGAVQGVQTAFFMIQGIAVVATARVHPRGKWVPLAVGCTIAFNLATGALFIASAHQIYPFWSRTPAWVSALPGARPQRAHSPSTRTSSTIALDRRSAAPRPELV